MFEKRFHQTKSRCWIKQHSQKCNAMYTNVFDHFLNFIHGSFCMSRAFFSLLYGQNRNHVVSFNKLNDFSLKLPFFRKDENSRLWPDRQCELTEWTIIVRFSNCFGHGDSNNSHSGNNVNFVENVSPTTAILHWTYPDELTNDPSFRVNQNWMHIE